MQEADRPDAAGVGEGWCPECHRLIGVGCACGMSFLDKMRSVQVDRESLKYVEKIRSHRKR